MSVSSFHLQIVDSETAKGSAAFIIRVAAVGSELGTGPVQKAALPAWSPDDVVNEHRPPLKCLPWDSSNLFAF